MRLGFVLIALQVTLPIWQPASAQIPQSARDFLAQQGTEYWRARAEQDGLTRTPADLLDHLLAGEPILVVDVRSREEFERFHFEGARSIPLPDLLASGGLADLMSAQQIWVVGTDGPEAVEAMVFMRVAGLRALAVIEGMEALRLSAGETAHAPAESPLADDRIRDGWESVRGLFAGQEPVPKDPPVPGSSVQQEVPLNPLEARGINLWIVGAAGTAAVALIGTLLYFLFWIPRRKRRALSEALELLATAEAGNLERGEELLSRALTAGLKPAELSVARFALAYVRARLERYTEAVALIREISNEYREPEDVYLELWLEAKQDNHAEVVRIYDEHAEDLGELLDAKMIAGLALLQEGRSHLARRETELALSFFQRLKKLDVWTGKLPSNLDDRQVLLGIQSLIDKNTDDAEKHFKGAVAVARDEGKPTVYPRLGLLLCRWQAEDHPDIDEELRAVLEEMEADLVPSPAQRISSDDDDEPLPPRELCDEEKLVRDVLLWFIVSRLFLWLRLPERQGLPNNERLEVEGRLARVSEIDSEMGDVHLLAGLLKYYFADNYEERCAALKRLERALATDVNLPEVRYLVERERKLAEAAANSLESYLKLVRDYLTDDGVPLELRRQLKERLERFKRFREFGEAGLQVGEGDYVPTLQDFQTRGALMRRRVQSIVQFRLRDLEQERELEEIEEQIEQLKEHTDALAASARNLERSEQGLMVVTGEFLLKEEEAPAAPDKKTSGKGRKISQ